MPIHVRTGRMVLHLDRVPMPHGKSVRRRVAPTVKDEHHRPVHRVTLSVPPWVHLKLKRRSVERTRTRDNIRIPRGATVNHKDLKDLHQQDRPLINTTTEQTRRMDHLVHLPTKDRLVTTISRPIRHLRPITVADERDPHTYCTVVRSRRSLVCLFVVLYRYYLYN